MDEISTAVSISLTVSYVTQGKFSIFVQKEKAQSFSEVIEKQNGEITP